MIVADRLSVWLLTPKKDIGGVPATGIPLATALVLLIRKTGPVGDVFDQPGRGCGSNRAAMLCSVNRANFGGDAIGKPSARRKRTESMATPAHFHAILDLTSKPTVHAFAETFRTSRCTTVPPVGPR
jgi:hypothetical protein